MRTLFEQVNDFMNNVDPMGIACDDWNEYDIEARSLIAMYKDGLSVDEIAKCFDDVMMEYFGIEYKLSAFDALVLENIFIQSR